MKALWRQPSGLVLKSASDGWHTTPGPGSGRFHHVLDGLRASGNEIALASFTFDEDASGSIAIAAAPSTASALQFSPLPPGRLIDDGIDQWRVSFHDAMKAINHGDLDKVVVSRRVTAKFDDDIDILAVAARLAARHASSYVFCLDGFVGASPELLVELVGGRLRTQTLAGTAVNQVDLDTEKQRSEHAFAAESVRAALSELVTDTPSESVSTVTQGDFTHLATLFETTVRPGVTISDCLSALHPTAAVAGTPTDAAMSHIASSEAPRGRYAGPVGWMNIGGEGVFALALRCAQITGNNATLYTGGGLVSGSVEQAELDETVLKLDPMLSALELSLS